MSNRQIFFAAYNGERTLINYSGGWLVILRMKADVSPLLYMYTIIYSTINVHLPGVK